MWYEEAQPARSMTTLASHRAAACRRPQRGGLQCRGIVRGIAMTDRLVTQSPGPWPKGGAVLRLLVMSA